MSSGTRFGENLEDERVEPHDSCADLYQIGYPSLGIGHRVQLVRVLESWVGMVRRGDWKVGKEGVEGGIEEWKRADESEEWGEKYVVPMSW
jgi:hypothetical protein